MKEWLARTPSTDRNKRNHYGLIQNGKPTHKPTTNNEVKNFEYSVKKSYYQEHLKDWPIARIAADHKNDWKKQDIETRAAKIAEWAQQYWEL
jgi:hypothetical protein